MHGCNNITEITLCSLCCKAELDQTIIFVEPECSDTSRRGPISVVRSENVMEVYKFQSDKLKRFEKSFHFFFSVGCVLKSNLCPRPLYHTQSKALDNGRYLYAPPSCIIFRPISTVFMHTYSRLLYNNISTTSFEKVHTAERV